MITAIGIELSTDTETASVAVAGRPEGAWRAEVNLVYYGPDGGAVAAVTAAYADPGCCGTWCDPAQVAGLLGDLRSEGVWLHELGAVEVAAASYVFKAAVRARRVKTSGHEALKAAMQYAMRRPLASAFAFERRKVAADMAPLNAAAFAVFGLQVNEGGDSPGVFMIGAGGGEAALTARGRLSEQETADLVAAVYKKTRAGLRRPG